MVIHHRFAPSALAWLLLASAPCAAASWSWRDLPPRPEASGPSVQLADGSVLAIAVEGPSHLFQPATERWIAVGALVHPRSSFAATLLHDGRVLIAGGAVRRDGTAVAVADCEAYDPSRRSWSRLGTLMAPRAEGCAAPLPDGRVLVAGGTVYQFVVTDPQAPPPFDGYSPALRTAEIFDPRTGRSTRIAGTAVGHWGGVALPLRDGRVLIYSGIDAIERYAPDDLVAEIFDPSRRTWRTAAGTPYPIELDAGESRRLVELPDGRVLVASGITVDMRATHGERVLDTHTLRWSWFASFAAVSVGLVRRRDGAVMSVGGYDVYHGEPREVGWARMLASGSDAWLPAPALNHPAADPDLFPLPDGRVLALGSANEIFGPPPHGLLPEIAPPTAAD